MVLHISYWVFIVVGALIYQWVGIAIACYAEKSSGNRFDNPAACYFTSSVLWPVSLVIAVVCTAVELAGRRKCQGGKR